MDAENVINAWAINHSSEWRLLPSLSFSYHNLRVVSSEWTSILSEEPKKRRTPEEEAKYGKNRNDGESVCIRLIFILFIQKQSSP